MERKLRDKLTGGKFRDVPPAHSGRMRSIKARGNKSTELRVRAKLIRAGIRGWRMHVRDLPGKPDIVFPRERVVLFVDGCYWHGCPCCVRPRNVNRGYWTAKIAGNRRRDAKNTRKLEDDGYRVVRVWEHELEHPGLANWLLVLRAAIGETGSEERAGRRTIKGSDDGQEAGRRGKPTSPATAQSARVGAHTRRDSGRGRR